MFEVPDAKRVRRNELDDRSSVDSAEVDEEARAHLREVLNSKLASSLSWDITPIQQPAAVPPPPAKIELPAEDAQDEHPTETEDEEEPPEEFEFRLFGTSQPAAKILLEKDRPFKPGEGGIIARRPISYYFARPATAAERARYEASVMTFEQIIERSRRRFWGLERPWKTVATITVRSKRKGGLKDELPGSVVCEGPDEEGKKMRRRKRPGKKMRIKQRMREKARKEKQEAEEKARLEKDEHLKAKKKRLNSIKKVRARAKAKAKKQAAREAAGETLVVDDGSGAKEGRPDVDDVPMEG